MKTQVLFLLVTIGCSAAAAAAAASPPETAPAQCTPGSCDDNNPCTVDTCDPTMGCIHTPANCDDGNVCTVDSCSPGGGPGLATLFIGHDVSQLARQYQKNGTFVQPWGATGRATGSAIDANGIVYVCNPAYGANVIEKRGPGNTNLGTITATVNGQWIEDMGNFVAGYILASTFEGSVFKIDTTTGAHTLLFPTGQILIGVTYDGTNIWTTGGSTNTLVYKRDLAGNVLATFNAGQNCGGIGYDPDDGTLWIGHASGQVTHHTQAGTLLGGFSTSAGGYYIDGLELGNLLLQPGCQHTALDCNDNDPCTVDACDPMTGCSHPPQVCDDGNVCTDDFCVPETGCVYTNNTAPCDDGNFCTTGDVCSNGLCGSSGPPNDCSDNNPCTDDSCNPRLGCSHVNNTNFCNDGNACTVEDMCVDGACHPGIPVNCDDGNVCTDDSCVPAMGCVHASNTKPCDDGNACTTGDFCNGGACHPGVPAVCSTGDQCHLPGTCDPATGGCFNAPKPDGTACNDGNPCTLGDVCIGGACGGGGIIAVPVETQNLGFAADKSTVTWSPVPEATSYDVVRGSVSGLPVGGSTSGEVCFEGLSAPAFSDTTIPADRVALWYLSRARNPCGYGPLGVQSNGTMRASTCP